MFKIDKNTHMLILFTFAIIFVVIYLYYTILDVRKLQKELKKSADELAEAKSKIALLEQSLAKKEAPPSIIQLAPAKPQNVPTSQTPPPPVVTLQKNIPKEVIKEAIEVTKEEVESVVTEDIRDTLDYSSSDDDEVQQAPVQETQTAQEHQAQPAQAQQSQQAQPVQVIEQEVIEEEDDDITLDSILKTNTEQQHQPKYELAYLQKLKYDDLRELCKTNEIVPKGTKEALINKLSELQA